MMSQAQRKVIKNNNFIKTLQGNQRSSNQRSSVKSFDSRWKGYSQDFSNVLLNSHSQGKVEEVYQKVAHDSPFQKKDLARE